jgi:hypothetical protein
MKTAMQELISELKRVEDYPKMSFVIRIANDLLEKEKEQILRAYGWDRFPCSEEDEERYYNETYNKNK